jgi:hypothetical protein
MFKLYNNALKVSKVRASTEVSREGKRRYAFAGEVDDKNTQPCSLQAANSARFGAE